MALDDFLRCPDRLTVVDLICKRDECCRRLGALGLRDELMNKIEHSDAVIYIPQDCELLAFKSFKSAEGSNAQGDTLARRAS